MVWQKIVAVDREKRKVTLMKRNGVTYDIYPDDFEITITQEYLKSLGVDSIAEAFEKYEYISLNIDFSNRAIIGIYVK